MAKTTVQSVIAQLHVERTRLESELHRIHAALTAFGKVYVGGKNAKNAKTGARRGKISAAGRRRIAAAQRARWAKIRATKKAR